MATIPEGVAVDALRAPEGADRVWALLEAVASSACLEVVDRLTRPYLSEIVIKGWEKFSEISIRELFELIRLLTNPRHREALASDLIDKGMRLRDFPSERHNWADLKVIVKNLDEHSALYCVYHPERAHWDLQNMLLASIADSLHWLQWARTADGSKGRNRPKPIPRPGVVDEQREGARVTAIPRSQLKARMAARYAANARNDKAKLTAGLGRRLPTQEPDRASRLAKAFHGRT